MFFCVFGSVFLFLGIDSFVTDVTTKTNTKNTAKYNQNQNRVAVLFHNNEIPDFVWQFDKLSAPVQKRAYELFRRKVPDHLKEVQSEFIDHEESELFGNINEEHPHHIPAVYPVQLYDGYTSWGLNPWNRSFAELFEKYKILQCYHAQKMQESPLPWHTPQMRLYVKFVYAFFVCEISQ